MKHDITLIFPESPFLINQAVFPPLGILYLSAFLKESGFKVQCLDLSLNDHKKEMAESDIIGISFSTPQRSNAFELASYYSKLGKTVIAGGPHATHMEEECEKYFDYVIKGYGEEKLLELMVKLHTGCEAGFQRRDINDFPFPDRDALPIKAYKYEIDGEPATPVMTSRGCPYDCPYCARIEKGCSFQTAERTVRELNHIHESYGFNAFMIFDDIFIDKKKRLKKISHELNGRFKIRCFGRTNLIDAETCEDMARLGVVEVGLGIESGSDEILAKNMKGTSREMNINAVKLLKQYGIRAKTFLIVGLPGETEATINETESWINEAMPDDLDISVFQPLPGSKIFNDPEGYGVKFNYNGIAGWYKGTPGKYKAMADTEELSGAELVAHRDRLESKYKRLEFLR
jgi:radical SAM superfamily enzyme YgiQ (UPF0313 family)